MTLRDALINIILGASSLLAALFLNVFGTLLAEVLNDKCKKAYGCGFLQLIYRKASETGNCALERAKAVKSLLVQTITSLSGQVRTRLLAAGDLIISRFRLYRLRIRSILLKSFSTIKGGIATGRNFVNNSTRALPFFTPRQVRVALIATIAVNIVVIPVLLHILPRHAPTPVAEDTLPRERFIAERELEQLDPGPGEWTYRGVRSEDKGTRLEIFHNGQKAYSYGAYFLDFVTFSGEGDDGYPGIFVEGAGEIKTKDITGDGVPDVLLVEDCGCSAGTMTYTLLSLGRQVNETFTTDEWIGENAWHLEDIDGDGVYEAVGPEFPIMIREEGYKWAGPSVELILKYHKGKYSFAADLMRHAPPARSEFLAEVEKAKQEIVGHEIHPDSDIYYAKDLPDSVFAYAIDLIYTGNGELAHEYIDLVFSDQTAEQRDFLWAALCTDLSGKTYWPEVAAMNHWSVDQYAFKG